MAGFSDYHSRLSRPSTLRAAVLSAPLAIPAHEGLQRTCLHSPAGLQVTHWTVCVLRTNRRGGRRIATAVRAVTGTISGSSTPVVRDDVRRAEKLFTVEKRKFARGRWWGYGQWRSG